MLAKTGIGQTPTEGVEIEIAVGTCEIGAPGNSRNGSQGDLGFGGDTAATGLGKGCLRSHVCFLL
jgi:hypothetical protein